MIDPLRLLLARDVAALPPIEGWDAGAWEAVHQTVLAWDAAPLAGSAVRAAGLAKSVPPAIFAEWRRDHTATTAVNMRLAFEAGALVEALRKRGVRSAPLKGSVLFQRGVYRDPGARPTCDVDLLVAAADSPEVTRALIQRGYTQSRAGGPKHLPPFVRDGLMVEVHEHAFWSLSDGHRVGLPEMLDVHGRPALAPAVAHLLHHLFESSVTTPWLVVKTLADLAEVRAFAQREAGSTEIADEIAACAGRFGLGRRLGALAGMLARVLDRPVPEAWLREARAADVEALFARAAPQARAFETALRLPDRLAGLARMPAAETLARLRHYLVPPADTMRMFYGLGPGSKWVWPLYPLRPIQLLGRSALDAARLLVARRAGPPGSPPGEVDPGRKKA